MQCVARLQCYNLSWSCKSPYQLRIRTWANLCMSFQTLYILTMNFCCFVPIFNPLKLYHRWQPKHVRLLLSNWLLVGIMYLKSLFWEDPFEFVHSCLSSRSTACIPLWENSHFDAFWDAWVDVNVACWVSQRVAVKIHDETAVWFKVVEQET